MKKFLATWVCLIYVLLMMVSCGGFSGRSVLQSPSMALLADVDLSDGGVLSYSVRWGGDTIIGRSVLGLVVDGDTLQGGFKVVGSSQRFTDSIWTASWGPNRIVRDRYNSLKLKLKHTVSGKRLDVMFRLYDDALAFRYELPEGQARVINDELTEIRVLENPMTWWSYADFNTYEKEFFATVLDSASWVASPVIMRRGDGRHVAVNEASVVGYPDMTLKNMGAGVLKVELTPWKDSVKVKLHNGEGIKSPWRMISVAADVRRILGSSTMLNLNEPNKLSDVSYCKPMTYVGIWWDFHLGTKEWKEGERQGANTFEAMRHIEFAMRNGIGGVVVEGWNKGWDKWGQKDAFDYVSSADNYDLEAVAAYAKDCGVRLIMHHETGADIDGYESRMDSAFRLCQRLGISDLKTGHAGGVSTGENHHGQQMVEHFDRVVKKAAQYGIALDMHEPVKGSGLERTYPNVMTREAVRGIEWEAWSKGNSPSHTTLIPFTRSLAGPTDYTPGIFDVLYKNAKDRMAWNTTAEMVKETRVHSTLMHQLGLMVTVYSPWVMAADRIDNYEKHPAFQFVRDFDPDFDQTIFLEAAVGEYVVVARRSGKRWYIGGTTNEQGRTVHLPLYFLANGEFDAVIYKDGKDADWVKNPLSYEIEQCNVSSQQLLTLEMAAGGGFAIVITPKDN